MLIANKYLRSNESVNGGHIRGSALRFLTSITLLYSTMLKCQLFLPRFYRDLDNRDVAWTQLANRIEFGSNRIESNPTR